MSGVEEVLRLSRRYNELAVAVEEAEKQLDLMSSKVYKLRREADQAMLELKYAAIELGQDGAA